MESHMEHEVVLDSDVEDTEFLDICESASHTGDWMEDQLEKKVVIDSDEEGGNQNRNQVNRAYFPITGRLSGRGVIRVLKQQQLHAGHFQKHGNKFSEHVPFCLDPAKSVGSDESNARRPVPYIGGFEEHHVVTDHIISNSSYQKLVSLTADDIPPNRARKGQHKHSPERRQLSSHESKSLNTEKNSNYGCESTELNCIDLSGPLESQDKVLNFVDHYLSVTDFGLYEADETRTSNRIKSPPSLWSKGSQSLARRINHGFADCKLKTYDWDTEQIEKNEYPTLSMNEDSSVHQASEHENLQKKMTSFQSIEKFPGVNDSDTNSLYFKGNNKLDSHSGICVDYDLVVLNEQLVAGLPSQNVEGCDQVKLTPDSLDIGLDTQIAAEAMEALVNATPVHDAGFNDQVSDNKLLTSSGAAYEESKSNNVIYPREAFVSWRCKAKRSRCAKIPPVVFKNGCFLAGRQPEIQKGTAVLFQASRKLKTKNPRIMKDLNRGRTENTKNLKCRGPHEVTLKPQGCVFSASDRLKDFQKHQSLYDRRFKEATDVIKSDCSMKQRMMISLQDEVCQKAVGGNCLKLNSYSYLGVKMDSVEREENYHLNVTNRGLSKLKWWACPKGKRTHQCVPHRSLRSRSPFAPSAAIEYNVDICSIGNEDVHERVEKLVIYKRRRKSSITGSCSSSVNGCQFSDKKVKISINCDSSKPSQQVDKMDGSKLPHVDASGNMKLAELSNKHLMGLQMFEGNDNIKRPCNSLSKSPLMKELTRLGYAESLPDFLPKDSRRRRAMDRVCILFSQNLKSSILKQQKKIVARLGLSVASCCADATHFITDRFVRTRNMLEAIALGKPVVTHIWLESCEQAGYVVDEKNFILGDEKKEKEIGFNMSISLTRASQRPLLKGRAVLLTPNVKPSMDVIIGLVRAVDGQVVPSMLEAQTKDNKAIPDDLLVLSCNEDFKYCMPFLEKGTSIYDSELLLDGIVTQKLEYERYELFKTFMKDR